MKRSALVILLALLLPFPLLAQPGAPPLILVYDEAPRPDQTSAYEAATKKFFQMLVDAMPDATWTAIQTDDIHYYYVIPIPSFATIDGMHQSMAAMIGKVGPEKFNALMAEMGPTVDHTDSRVLMRRDDLSYRPEKDLAPGEAKFFNYDVYYLKPGMEFAMEGVAKEWAALLKSKGAARGFTVYQQMLGSDAPMMVIMTPAKDPLELAQAMVGNQAKLGAAGGPLWAKTMSMTRRLDRNTGWLRPDLSGDAFKKKP